MAEPSTTLDERMLHGVEAPEKRVLIVEDDLMMCDLYRHVFSATGISEDSIDVEHYLTDACTKAMKQQYDLYITDGQYPLDRHHPEKLNEACKTFVTVLQERYPSSNVVIVSGMAQQFSSWAKERDVPFFLKDDMFSLIHTLAEEYLS